MSWDGRATEEFFIEDTSINVESLNDRIRNTNAGALPIMEIVSDFQQIATGALSMINTPECLIKMD